MTVEWVKQGNLTGPIGPVGPPNSLSIGEVTTLEWTEPATAEISGEPPNQVLDLGIPQGSPGEGSISWDDVTDKPTTFPPTLPIPSSGVTGLDTKQASQDAAIAAINWTSLPGKPATFPPTLPIPSSGVSGLDAKQADQDLAITGVGDAVNAEAAARAAADALLAPKASPALTGTPTAPTAAPGNSTTQLATTAFVGAALATTGASVGTVPPASPATGKMFWHSTEKTLYIWDGTAWQAVFGTWAT